MKEKEYREYLGELRNYVFLGTAINFALAFLVILWGLSLWSLLAITISQIILIGAFIYQGNRIRKLARMIERLRVKNDATREEIKEIEKQSNYYKEKIMKNALNNISELTKQKLTLLKNFEQTEKIVLNRKDNFCQGDKEAIIKYMGNVIDMVGKINKEMDRNKFLIKAIIQGEKPDKIKLGLEQFERERERVSQ